MRLDPVCEMLIFSSICSKLLPDPGDCFCQNVLLLLNEFSRESWGGFKMAARSCNLRFLFF